jgi:hypothetical protein
MMKRVSGIFLTLVLSALLLSAAPAWCESYFIYDQYGGTWHDANKTAANTEDDLMCWAAAASNILSWGQWDTPLYETASQMFQHFQDHWTDNTGYMSWAWKWWFNGSPPPYTFASYPDVPGGGNFFPSLNFTDYYTYASGGNIMSVIDSLLHQGKGVTLVISGGGAYSHAVTAWGFSYVDPGAYTSIFLTDSDDNFLGLREYPLVWENNAWYLGGAYSGWKIGGIQALGYSPSYYEPLDPGPIQSGDTSPVPIAPTWLLLGTGLSSLLLLGRRRRQG